MGRVYLDHNATTPLRPEAREALLETLDVLRGNPSSVHGAGRKARQLLDEARERIAAALRVQEDEILFTSGGTEANNLALLGALRACGPGSGLVTTAVEHSAVLEPAEVLRQNGHPVHVVPVDEQGLPRMEALLEAAADAALVSVMAANNEVGSVPELGRLRAGLERLPRRPLLHSDAVQALGKIPVDLEAWGVDLASFSAHKIGGPVGMGLLIRSANVALTPLQYGGGQEAGLRPGTENVAGIVATAVAVECAVKEQHANATRMRALLLELWSGIRALFPSARLLGPSIDDNARLPNTLNVLLPDANGQVLITRLDLLGLEASAGSACASGSLEPSHVLLAMGLSRADARSGLRLSLGRTTSQQDVAQAVDNLSSLCAK